MIIITDVNVILSALIKDSTTREIIFKSGLEFFFPEASLHKIGKYKDLIIEKSMLSEEEYTKLLDIMFQFIELISNEELKLYWEEANKIMAHIDSEDVPFIAAALSKERAFIWSDDKHFERQERIYCFKTEEMTRLFRKE